MMATVPHITSGSGLRKFQADGFLFNRVYTARLYDSALCYLASTCWIISHNSLRSVAACRGTTPIIHYLSHYSFAGLCSSSSRTA